MIGDLPERATGPINLKILANRGEPLAKFWSPGTGGGGHRPLPPLPPGPPRRPPSPPPRTPGYQPGEWIPQGEGGQQAQSAPATGLAALGLSDSGLDAFAAALQGVVAAGVSAALPSPSQSGPMRKVATLSLLYLRFACRVAADVVLPHLGVGHPGTRQDGGASHPQPGPDDGLAILSPDLWREGAVQRLPSPAQVC